MIKRRHLDKIIFTIPESIKKFEDYPKITNYVSTVSLGIKFDLNSTVFHLSSSYREPRRFAAITIRITPTTALLFSTGNMVVGGAKTEFGSILAAHTYRLFLEKMPQAFYSAEKKKFFYSTLEKYTKFENFKVRNVVGSGKLFNNETINNIGPNQKKKSSSSGPTSGYVDLDSFARNNIVSAGWDRDIFPGMRLNIEKSDECPLRIPSLMAHVFEGTNDVLMGAEDKEDIYIGHDHLRKIISPYLTTLENKQENFSKKSQIIEDAFKNANSIKMHEIKKKKKRKIPSINDDEENSFEKDSNPKNKDDIKEPPTKKIKLQNKEEKKEDEDDTYEKYMDSVFGYLKENKKENEEEKEKSKKRNKEDIIMDELEKEFDF